MIQVLKIAFNCWLRWRWMKDINRTAAIQPLPALCNGPGISPVYIIPIHSRSSHGTVQAPQQRSPQLLLPSSPTSCCQLMAALLENSSTTQAARGATWMGAFWNKKEEGRRGKGMEKRRELKWNTWIWVRKLVLFLAEASQADSLTCVYVTWCVWPAKSTDMLSKHQQFSSLLRCDADQSTRLLLGTTPAWWRQRWTNLLG